MRRVLIHLDVDVLKHDETFALSDERIEKEIGAMVNATLPRRLGIGTTPVEVPDGRGGFTKKPAVLVTLVRIGVAAVPEGEQPTLEDQPPAEPRGPKILTP